MDAERAVCAFYGLRMVPAIRWYAPGLLTYNRGEGETLILQRRPGQPLSQTALAHELYHFARAQQGDATGDFQHRDPGWLPGGKVDQAIALLKAMGE